jgi:polyvinyl alcohol dehydrogenase (cytochrome)
VGAARTLTALASPVQEWPVYGADLANSRTSTAGPVHSSAGRLHVAWRDVFPDGDFTGTPVVSGGVVFVGSNGGIVRAIQATSGSVHAAGAVLWTTKVAGPVNGSLAVAAGTVYVPVARLGSPELVALSAATGQQEWATVIDSSSPDADLYGSPVPVNLPGTATTLVLQGVSAVNGDPASPLRNSVSAVDASSGTVAWKTYMVPPGFNGGAVWSTPAVDTSTGSVFVGTGNAYSGKAAPTTDSMVKLDLGTGTLLGWYQATAGDVFSSSTPGLDFDFGASPNLISAGGRALVGEGQKGGVYWALDRSTMKPVWHTTVGVGSAAGGILGSTAYDATTGRIVGPESLPGYLWSLDAAGGSINWLIPIGVDLVHLTPVSISNGVAYSVATTGFLEALDEATGLPLALLPLNPIPPQGGYTLGEGSGVAIADGLVIADAGSGQTSNGIVVAFTA